MHGYFNLVSLLQIFSSSKFCFHDEKLENAPDNAATKIMAAPKSIPRKHSIFVIIIADLHNKMFAKNYSATQALRHTCTRV